MSTETAPDLDVTQTERLVSLRDLVQSPGWQLLREQATQEWGPEGYGRRMQRALSEIPSGPDRAYELARVAEQVDATAKAVNEIMQWPGRQIATLQADTPRSWLAGHRRLTQR